MFPGCLAEFEAQTRHVRPLGCVAVAGVGVSLGTVVGTGTRTVLDVGSDVVRFRRISISVVLSLVRQRVRCLVGQLGLSGRQVLFVCRTVSVLTISLGLWWVNSLIGRLGLMFSVRSCMVSVVSVWLSLVCARSWLRNISVAWLGLCVSAVVTRLRTAVLGIVCSALPLVVASVCVAVLLTNGWFVSVVLVFRLRTVVTVRVVSVVARVGMWLGRSS